MKKRLFITLLTLYCSSVFHAQEHLKNYKELSVDHLADRKAWDSLGENLYYAWGSTDVRYPQKDVPKCKNRSLTLSGWRGEKMNAQFVLWSSHDWQNISFCCSDLREKQGNIIPSESITANFVSYVMTDELNKDRKGGCGPRPDKTQWDSLLVADVIDVSPTFDLKKCTVRPVWVRVSIPQSTAAGNYTGRIQLLSCGKEIGTLDLEIDVGKRVLPQPSEWKFHLDLWQNPYAVARYYNVKIWSKEHFDAMRPIMQALADAGQKVITASIMHKPWGGQTFDYFESMVTWIKRYDDSWEFKFDVFDAWVEFMMSLGIDKQINCYSMVPWSLSFRYFDQKTNEMRTLHTQPGEKAYEEMWIALLKSFSRHLKEKGWFDKTCIAMDERPLSAMKQVIGLIHKADKNFKLSLAGLYYEEIESEIHDYSISTDQFFPWKVIERRNAEGKVTTYYTYCADARPNTFTFSAPAEAAWIGLYAARLNMNGYLRWAYNSWVEYPLQDSRFITWAGGDTYLVYPGFRSSIRFERLIEGIQQYEKICILKEEYLANGEKRRIGRIDKMLEIFNLEELKLGASAEISVSRMERVLNKL